MTGETVLGRPLIRVERRQDGLAPLTGALTIGLPRTSFSGMVRDSPEWCAPNTDRCLRPRTPLLPPFPHDESYLLQLHICTTGAARVRKLGVWPTLSHGVRSPPSPAAARRVDSCTSTRPRDDQDDNTQIRRDTGSDPHGPPPRSSAASGTSPQAVAGDDSPTNDLPLVVALVRAWRSWC